MLSTLVPMFAFGVVGYLIPGNILGTDTNDAFIFGCIPVVAFFIYLYVRANAEDKRPIGALLAVFGCLVIFWAVFHQNGDALTVWAKDYTNREMPMSVSNVADKLNMAETVTNNGAETAPNSAQYFATMAPERVPAEGQNLKLYSTQLYQSINPFWVVLLTPIIVGFWGFMRSRKREPSTPTKIASAW